MVTFMTIREVFDLINYKELEALDAIEYIQLQGWVRTNRSNGSIGFIELNDGTYFKNAQLVYDLELANFKEVEKYLTGSALTITGKLVLTPEGKQPFEVKVTEVVLEGACDSDYPLQKKRHSFEYLREIPHLRVRTNTFTAVFRLRSVLSMGIHEFFQSQGFIYVHTPIITSNDGEGAGEVFTVTTRRDENYEKDFFARHTFLTVTGQLHVEAFAQSFRDVYTFGPTFRAEKSNTPRHASEFWMIEPEIAFADLEDNMNLIEDMVKYLINYVLVNCPAEMEFFNQMIDKNLLERLNLVKDAPFKKMTYTEAIEYLEKAPVEFEYPVYWGCDLQSEHERYICEQIVQGPVFITDYPAEIKAFYMRANEDGKTVAACDLLVPYVGELVGASQREERLDVLKAKMAALKIPEAGLEWYLDLRRYGGVKHAGFGLGFERFIMYLTGLTNIRDVLPYPRTPRQMKF